MNEELKIIIRAVTDEAQRNMASVRKELEGIEKTSTKSGQSVGAAMKGIAKGVAVAIGAVAALTTAMAALGKSAQEVQKSFDKLNTTFLKSGSTTGQAAATYKELFGFLGEHDKAVETAQSLALITAEEEKLAEWTTILQGAFAEMGDKLPIEGLAEAANETINTGVVTGVLADALNWAKISEDDFNAALSQTASLEEREALVRNTLNGLYSTSAKLYEQNSQATIRYNKSQADLNLKMAQLASYTTPLLTALNELSTVLLTALTPALQTVAIYLTAFIQLLAEAIVWVGNFFGLFSENAETATADVEGYQNAMKNYQEELRNAFSGSNSETEEQIKNLEKLKKQTMGFDELNIVSSPTAATTPAPGAGGGGANVKIPGAPNPADYGIGVGIDTEAITESIEEAKETMKGLLTVIGLVGGALALWKISDFLKNLWDSYKIVKALGDVDLDEVWNQLSGAEIESIKFLDKVKAIAKSVAGWALVIVGFAAAVWGFTDAFKNGVDWDNMIAIVAGVGLAIGGVFLALGKTIGMALAPWLLVAGGIALVVAGVKDLIENGYSMEAVIAVAVGAIAILIGVVWALNAALLANPITWVVVAIMALVAAFVVLWNECEGFRNFFINAWEAIKNAAVAVWDWLVEFFTVTIPSIFNAVIDFVKENWQGLLLLLVNPFAGAFKLLYDNCEGFRNFINKWIGIIANFFKDLWSGIKNIFAGVGKWFSDVFTAAGNGIKKAFSSIGNFFSGIWTTIKNIFSKVGTTIGNAVSGAFKSAINWVLEKAIGLINGFIKSINWAIDIINKIPGVSISRLSLIDVPKLATGGITNGATMAMIGERGKEAVLPLENNTGWMDALADRIAARNNTPSKIVLKVGEKELGWATINSINDITKQTGGLQLHLV